ncbi:MAG: hypothetical protein Q7J04_08830, partial [Microcella sp.]|nr:hypothetical protein [Microcella sp.]
QWAHDVIERYVETSRRDEVDGLLFDSGRGYPLAKFEPGGSVAGYLIELDASTRDDAMRALTQFEGGLFHPVEVRTRSGATALAYEWIGSSEGYPRIDFWHEALAGDFGAVVPVNTLAVGDCFDPTSTAGQGIIVNCSALPYYTIYHIYELTDGQFPGLQALLETAATQCGSAFEAEYGRALDPEIDPWYFPSSSAWSEGDRVLVCASQAWS